MSQNFPSVEYPQKVRLKAYGFRNAGLSAGDPAAFKNQLELIHNGKLLDEKITAGLTGEERKDIDNQIDIQKNDVISLHKNLGLQHRKIEDFQEQIELYNEERQDIILGKKGLSIPGGRFNSLKFTVNSFFLLMLSIYLFLFYVATVYKALFIDLDKLAQMMQNGSGLAGGGALPSPQEMWEALHQNVVVIFAPFIFYGFGYAMHVLIELSSRWKYLWIALVVAVTFVLDFLIAYKIHSNANQILELMGLNDQVRHWTHSPTFFIIIFMGFIVYLIWSILFHAWIKEWGKRDITGRIDDAIRDLKKQIGQFKEEIHKTQVLIEQKEVYIKKLTGYLNTIQIPESDLRFSISEFVAGWFNFLAGDESFNDTKKACEKVYEEFKKQHFS